MKRTLLGLALFTALSTSAVAAENNWKDDTKDAWIDGKAEATLLFNTHLNSFDIDTDVKMGKVTLTGEVASAVEKELAEEIVREIDGVTDVHNNLTLMTSDMDDMGDMKDKSHKSMSKDMHSMMDKSHKSMNKDMDEMEGMDDSAETWAMSDAEIVSDVKNRLRSETKLSGTSVKVTLSNRVITLRGSVKSEMERELAVSIAEDTDDVDAVNDMLTIKPATK